MKNQADLLIGNIQSVVSVNRVTLEYLTAALAAGGHVILADTHGVGKTSLARALAGSIRWPAGRGGVEDVSGEAVGGNPAGAGGGRSADRGDGADAGNHAGSRRTAGRANEPAVGYRSATVEPVYFNRIQCTVDLLPQDILGYSRITGDHFRMDFIPGPIFSHFILCDEINLLTPKTQGSFFQAMEEKTVSIEGNTYGLPSVFFIIATMNLRGSHLFPLPAPQLDRFMLQLSMGYPDEAAEKAIVSRHGRSDAWDRLKPVVEYGELLSWPAAVDAFDIHPEVLDYLVRIVRATRRHPQLRTGASPRTGVKLSRLVRALAQIRGEDIVTIDLVKEIFVPALAHRIEPKDSDVDPVTVLNEILASEPVDSFSRRSPRSV